MKLLNTVETYMSLQPFQTIEQLNANTAEIRKQYGDQLTRATYQVLDVLARYSCKYYGVSYRSKSKIATELGITRRTVINACNKLESLGVIVQHELRRHSGDRRQSSNAIVFVAIITIEKEIKKEDFTPKVHTKETPLNSNNINQSLHDTFASQQSLYNRFKSLLLNSIGEDTLASRLYGVYRAQSIKLKRFEIHRDKSELFEELALQALNITTQATRSKSIRNITGYYSGVLQELIGKALFGKAFMDYDITVEFATH
ncbi:MarR family transcriptional regulator [Sporosarcina siberiensis]|uniref:MarR family transcriptional regulator n=1 Tax=Sporosarcina siberiensis TaxID=1365606 RepID=A0ABW4SDE3_9BACL